MQKLITIGIADDHAIFRKGVIDLLSVIPNANVILEASNGKELIEKMATTMPDIVLMDLKMPEIDGIKATKILKEKYPDVKIVVLSMFEEDNFILHLMGLGAVGYLMKNEDPSAVIEAIQQVHERDYYITPKVQAILNKGLSNRKGNVPTFDYKLAENEKAVLQYTCAGMTNAKIAQKIFRSVRTVEGIRQQLLKKTGTQNTAALVAFAFRNNLIDLAFEFEIDNK